MAKLDDLQLSTGARKTFEFDHAKRDGTKSKVTVELRVLSKHEIDLARRDALQTVKDLSDELKAGKTYDEMLAEARTIELLARALMDPEKPDQPWATPMAIAQKLHPGAIGLLARAYDEHQEACGPFLHDMTSDVYEGLVADIAKEASADPLGYCASPLRNAFIITMARELVSLRTEKSSRSSESTELSKSGESATSDYVADTLGDHTAMIDALNDEVASMKVRLRNAEAALERRGE